MAPCPPKEVRAPTQDPVNAGVRSLPYLGEPDAVTRVLTRGTRSQEEGDVKQEVEAGMTCPERGCNGHKSQQPREAGEGQRPDWPLEASGRSQLCQSLD